MYFSFEFQEYKKLKKEIEGLRTLLAVKDSKGTCSIGSLMLCTNHWQEVVVQTPLKIPLVYSE